MRFFLATKSGSLLAFQVFVACQDTPALQDLPDGLGTHLDPGVLGEVVDQLREAPGRERQPHLDGLAGGDTTDLITAGRTELTRSAAPPFGDNAAISPADRPCADASTIPARRNRTRSFADLVIFTSR
jgi:hypothetical protein